MNVAAPVWKWEWNLNTVVVLVGFAGGFVAWGWTLNELQMGRTINATNIERLDARLSAVEISSRRLDNHELRISNVEKQATDGAAAMRSVEAALNGLTGDVRVVKEILQRIEADQRSGLPTIRER